MPAESKNWRSEGIVLTKSDFVGGKDDETELQSGEVGEFMRTEVGEDGQLSSYDYLRVGDNPDPIDPTVGKIFMEFAGTDTDPLPQNTEIRFAVRDKNSNRREPMTPWLTLRDLDRDRPDHRKVLRPRVKNGREWWVKSGRIVTLEIRNESESITPSFDEAGTSVEAPARGGW